MREKQSKLVRTNAGITLIALIITVIVMLILAGVAINLTVGDNGIFKKSQEGAEIYKNSANNEAASLNSVDKEMGDLINQYQGGSSTPIEKPGKPDSNGIYTENSTINGGTPEAFNPEIPKGFKPVDVDTAIWGDGSTQPTQEAVKAGLIIEDEEGNQFVWIAVDGETVKLGRYEFAEEGTESEYTGLNIEEDDNDTENLKNYGNTIAKDINAFKTSVANHGGYYIARYEASYGVDGKPNSKVSTSFSESSAPTVEGQLWNNITQPDATTACRNMYDSNYGVTSDLMNSYAWDTTIVFIQKYSGDTDYSRQDGKSINSALANTGENGDEKCHIQDMASNCYEWTTETGSNAYGRCVRRGGGYSGSNICTSYRGAGSTSFTGMALAFRALLYL